MWTPAMHELSRKKLHSPSRLFACRQKNGLSYISFYRSVSFQNMFRASILDLASSHWFLSAEDAGQECVVSRSQFGLCYAPVKEPVRRASLRARGAPRIQKF